MRLRQSQRVQSVSIACAALLFICLTASGAAQTEGGVSHPRTPEAVADLAMKRFHETLDFGTIWKELYVSDKALRDLEVEAVMFGKMNWEATEPISMAAKERAYVALQNFGMLLSAVRFTANSLEDLSGKLKEIKEPYEAWSRSKPASTEAELDRNFTAALNNTGNILRKHIVRENLDTPNYRDREAKFEENAPADPGRIREVFAEAGLRPETKIHVVSREIFHFYIIEEQGAFKILTLTHRRRF